MIETLTPILRRLIGRGGPGSGFVGHAGRPGERGGSAPGEGGGREVGGIKQSRTESDVPGRLLDYMREHFPATENITRSRWLGPDGEFYSEAGDHQKEALQAVSAAGLEGYNEWSAVAEVIHSGQFIRLSGRGGAIVGVDLPSAGLTREQTASLPRLMDALWAKVPSVQFTFGTVDKPEPRDGFIRTAPKATRDVIRELRLHDDWTPLPDAPAYLVHRGGPGSGHFGHAGRPGERGGSAPGEDGGRVGGIQQGRGGGETPEETFANMERQQANFSRRMDALPEGTVMHVEKLPGATSMAGTWERKDLAGDEFWVRDAGGPKEKWAASGEFNFHNRIIEGHEDDEALSTGFANVPGIQQGRVADPLDYLVREKPTGHEVLQWDAPRGVWTLASHERERAGAETYLKSLGLEPTEVQFQAQPRLDVPNLAEELNAVWGLSPVSTVARGGPGSGFAGHAGRPGQRGGSAPGGDAAAETGGKVGGISEGHGGEPTADDYSSALADYFGNIPASDFQWKPGADFEDTPYGPDFSWLTPEGRPIGAGGGHEESAVSAMIALGQHASMDDFRDAEVAVENAGFVRHVHIAATEYFEGASTATTEQLDSIRAYLNDRALWAGVHGTIPDVAIEQNYVDDFRVKVAIAGPVRLTTGGYDYAMLSGRDVMRVLDLSRDEWAAGAGDYAISLLPRRTDSGQIIERGGPGSGHFGHAGRPGERGGSAPGGGASPEREVGGIQQGRGSVGGVQQAREVARERIKQVSAIEPNVTATLTSLAEAHGGQMVNLSRRIKTEDSLARKIESEAADKGLAHEEAAADIVDALRYTMVFEPDEMVEKVIAVQAALAEQGWTQYDTRNRNYFAPGDAYDGYNTALVNARGDIFELQFHTPETASVKEEAHKFYEEYRMTAADETSRRGELWMAMTSLWSSIERPVNWERLPGVLATAQ